MFNLATEPQGIGRTIDNGFKLFFAGFKGAFLLLVLMILAMIVLVVGMSLIPMLLIDPATGGGMGGMIAMMIVFWLLIMLVMFGFQNAIMKKYGAVANGEDIGLGESLKFGLRKAFPVLLWMILYMIVLAVAAIPAIAVGFFLPPQEGLVNILVLAAATIPAIILGLTLIFGMYLIVLDDIGPIDALKLSHKLVWGKWWRTFLFLTIVYIIALVLMFAVIIPLGVVSPFIAGDNPVVFGIFQLVINIFSLVMVPFYIALIIPYLNDLKLRIEGSDLAARIETASA